VERYRREIDQAGGILLLAGVGPELREQLERTGVLAAIGEERVCEEQSTLTGSVGVAVETAERWLRESAQRAENRELGDDASRAEGPPRE